MQLVYEGWAFDPASFSGFLTMTVKLNGLGAGVSRSAGGQAPAAG